MAVKIRLTRKGKKKQPSYRVVVADSRAPRDGRYIEQIGRYDPRQEPSVVIIDNDRADYWLSVGAQPSDAVRKLLEISGALAARTKRDPKVHIVGEEAQLQSAAEEVEAAVAVEAAAEEVEAAVAVEAAAEVAAEEESLIEEIAEEAAEAAEEIAEKVEEITEEAEEITEDAAEAAEEIADKAGDIVEEAVEKAAGEQEES